MGQDERSFCTWDGDCLDESDRVASANTWQGQFPVRNTEADGYRYTSPVDAFDTTALGLQDMSGNVWEWTASWKRSYERRDAPLKPSEKRERVLQGGSFICDDCGGFFVFARSGNSPRTSLFQVGFRCAKDPAR